jgi:hypothetical protein
MWLTTCVLITLSLLRTVRQLTYIHTYIHTHTHTHTHLMWLATCILTTSSSAAYIQTTYVHTRIYAYTYYVTNYMYFYHFILCSIQSNDIHTHIHTHLEVTNIIYSNQCSDHAVCSSAYRKSTEWICASTSPSVSIYLTSLYIFQSLHLLMYVVEYRLGSFYQPLCLHTFDQTLVTIVQSWRTD